MIKTSISLGVGGVALGAVSILSGTVGLSLLDFASEPKASRPRRTAAVALGAAMVVLAVVALLHACQMVQVARGMA